MQEEIALRLKDVVFRFFEEGKRNILDHTELEIKSGTVSVIMGSSGCGKSTLAAVATGLYPENGGFLEQGEILLYGKKVMDMNPQERAADMTLMFQNPDLQFCMDTLRKEMRFCLENICFPPELMDEKINEAAKMFRLSDKLDCSLYSLSGGEKQKATLACLYLMESRCIILDEAFANIDEEASKEILQYIRLLKDKGRTVIAIDHKADLWMNIADEFIILGAGAKVLKRNIGSADFVSCKELLREQGLFIPAEGNDEYEYQAGCFDKQYEKEEAGIRLDSVTIYKPVNNKRSLRKKGGEVLLTKLKACFPKGKMTSIIGASGTGKTTLFLTMLKQHPYEGLIEIDGRNLRTTKKKELYRSVGIVFQNPANQFITQNVKQEVIAGLKTWNKGCNDEQLEKRADELLEKFGLSKYHRYSPYMLSQGQQRRLAVLSVLTGGQKILLLDEPTYGQDYASACAIMSEIKEKMKELGITVIVITHDRRLARDFSDKIYTVTDNTLVVVHKTDSAADKEDHNEA